MVRFRFKLCSAIQTSQPTNPYKKNIKLKTFPVTFEFFSTTSQAEQCMEILLKPVFIVDQPKI